MKKVLFVANYHSDRLRRDRRITANSTAAGSQKIGVIARALESLGYGVRIVSTGKTGRNNGRYFAGLEEPVTPEGRVIAYFIPLLDVKLVSDAFGLIFVVREVLRMWRANWGPARTEPAFLLVYNLTPQSIVATLLWKFFGLGPAYIEYEDSVAASRDVGGRSLKAKLRGLERASGRLFAGAIVPCGDLAGCLGARRVLLVEGVVELPLVSRPVAPSARPFGRASLFFGGTLDRSRGIDRLMAAVGELDVDVIITGQGPLAEKVREWCAQRPAARRFLGLVEKEQYFRLLQEADICVNPHLASDYGGLLWPFKLSEYLAFCGLVVSSNMRWGPPDVLERLYLYDFDDPKLLGKTIERLMRNLSELQDVAATRRAWALQRWGNERLRQRLAEFTSPTAGSNG